MADGRTPAPSKSEPAKSEPVKSEPVSKTPVVVKDDKAGSVSANKSKMIADSDFEKAMLNRAKGNSNRSGRMNMRAAKYALNINKGEKTNFNEEDFKL